MQTRETIRDHTRSHKGYSLKRLLKRVIGATGYELRRRAELQPLANDIRHAEVFPSATYSPWLADRDFLDVYEVIRQNTLVDIYRCYELWQLVSESAKLDGGHVLEIGVWRGGTGALIAKKCHIAGINAQIYLCDTFSGVVKAGSLDGVYVGGEHSDTSKDVVLELCSRLNLDSVQVLEGVFPEDTGSHLGDQQFRFCHIDVDVYESARDISNWIFPRLVPGGMIVYDDYGFYSCTGITRFVNEERHKADRIVIHNLNGHALVIKTGGTSSGRRVGGVH